MLTRTLFYIGLVFLLLAISGFVLRSTRRSSPSERLSSVTFVENLILPEDDRIFLPWLHKLEITPTPPKATPTAPTPLPTVIVETEWPRKMEINRSDSIRVSFIRASGLPLDAIVEIPGHTVVAATVVPVGTPQVSIDRAFGPEYEGYVDANLAGVAFDIESLTTERRGLNVLLITWEWNIIPREPGAQTININIEAQWEPTDDDDGQTIQRQLWRSRLDILVEEPFIVTGQLNILSLISFFIGSGLSIPWIYGKIGEAKEKKRREEENTPKVEIAKR